MNLIKYFRGRMSAVIILPPSSPLFFSLFSFFFPPPPPPRHGAIYFFNVRNELNALLPLSFPSSFPFSHPVLPIPVSRAIVSTSLLPSPPGRTFISSIFLHCPLRSPPPFYLFRASSACHFVRAPIGLKSRSLKIPAHFRLDSFYHHHHHQPFPSS